VDRITRLRRGTTALALAAVVTTTSVGCTEHDDNDHAPATSFDWHAAGAKFGAYLVKANGRNGEPELTKVQLGAKCARMASAVGTDKAEAQVQRLTNKEVDLAPVTETQRQQIVAGCTEAVKDSQPAEPGHSRQPERERPSAGRGQTDWQGGPPPPPCPPVWQGEGVATGAARALLPGVRRWAASSAATSSSASVSDSVGTGSRPVLLREQLPVGEPVAGRGAVVACPFPAVAAESGDGAYGGHPVGLVVVAVSHPGTVALKSTGMPTGLVYGRTTRS